MTPLCNHSFSIPAEGDVFRHEIVPQVFDEVWRIWHDKGLCSAMKHIRSFHTHTYVFHPFPLAGFLVHHNGINIQTNPCEGSDDFGNDGCQSRCCQVVLGNKIPQHLLPLQGQSPDHDQNCLVSDFVTLVMLAAVDKPTSSS